MMRYYQQIVGLSIVKAYCDKYKVDIKIDSKVDVGTTFFGSKRDIKEMIFY